MPKIDRIVVVGDTHTGSFWGLNPKNTVPDWSGKSWARYVLGHWEEAVKNWEQFSGKQILVLMGDLIEGKQRKAQGAGLYSQTMGEQVKAFLSLMEFDTNCFSKIYRVDGTPYHDGGEGEMGWIDERLDCEARQYLILGTSSGNISFAHHPGGGNPLYLGTKLDSTLRNLRSSIAAGKAAQANMSVRAHLHEYAFLENQGYAAVQTPCWKLADPYAIKLNPERFQPDLGWLALERNARSMAGWRPAPHLFDGLQESSVGQVKQIEE